MEKRTVLVVDDSVDVASHIAETLEAFGQPARGASSVIDALQALATDQTIGFVLADRTMPILSGDEFLKVVRQKYPHVGLALMTGYPPDEDDPTPPHNAPVLRKPFKVEAVITLCAHYTRNPGMQHNVA
jgi:CheY-like chemotaxis protein